MSKNLVAKWTSWAPQFLALLRIMIALVFMSAGAVKILAFPEGMPPDGGTAHFPSQIWWGGMLELVGGFLMLIGLFTRPVAFILSGEMAVAYFQFHAPGGFWPVMNGGISAILHCFVFLYFSAVGAGPWSVDAMRRR